MIDVLLNFIRGQDRFNEDVKDEFNRCIKAFNKRSDEQRLINKYLLKRLEKLEKDKPKEGK